MELLRGRDERWLGPSSPGGPTDPAQRLLSLHTTARSRVGGGILRGGTGRQILGLGDRWGAHAWPAPINDQVVSGEQGNALTVPDRLASIEAPGRASEGERLVLQPSSTMAIACGRGLLMVHCTEAGEPRIDYDDALLDVFLRVDQSVELRDGDMIGAGRRWLRYMREEGALRPRLQFLDSRGVSRMIVTLHDGTFTLGREFGDLVLPEGSGLDPAHLQILVRDDDTYLRNLAGLGRTWLMLPPGEVVPVDATLAVGERADAGTHARRSVL